MEKTPRYGKDATEVRIALDQSFVLELQALATAGYAWRATTVPDVIVLRDERIGSTHRALGAPTLQEFEFHAKHIGSGTLALHLTRHWETSPAESLELTVVVTGVS